VQINQPGRKAGTPSPAVNDISFLLGWARTPERWKELLEAADAGQAPQAETERWPPPILQAGRSASSGWA
jgi:hypothetical protein